jgi:hypothetical protein
VEPTYLGEPGLGEGAVVLAGEGAHEGKALKPQEVRHWVLVNSLLGLLFRRVHRHQRMIGGDAPVIKPISREAARSGLALVTTAKNPPVLPSSSWKRSGPSAGARTQAAAIRRTPSSSSFG